VNNARFLTLYEEARVALFFLGARDMGLTSFEDGIVISRHEVDYLRPLNYGDPAEITMWVEEIRASRFTIGYDFRSGDAVVSRARSVCVPSTWQGYPRRNAEEKRSDRWTDEDRPGGPGGRGCVPRPRSASTRPRWSGCGRNRWAPGRRRVGGSAGTESGTPGVPRLDRTELWAAAADVSPPAAGPRAGRHGLRGRPGRAGGARRELAGCASDTEGLYGRCRRGAAPRSERIPAVELVRSAAAASRTAEGRRASRARWRADTARRCWTTWRSR
jgi:acyl-CoA thioester hydrolase